MSRGLSEGRCDACGVYLDWRDVDVPARGDQEATTRRAPFTQGTDDRHRCRARGAVTVRQATASERAAYDIDAFQRRQNR
jgi:hypothetical protein